MGGILSSTPGPLGPPGPPGPPGATGLEGIPGNVSWEALSDAQKQAAYDAMQITLGDYMSTNTVFAEKVGQELVNNQTIVDTVISNVDGAGTNSRLIKTLADKLTSTPSYKIALKGPPGSIASPEVIQSTIQPKSMWCADGNTCKIPDDKYVTKLRVKAGDAVDFAADAPSQDITQTPNADSRGTSPAGLDGTIVGKYNNANTLDAAKASVLEIHGIGRPYPDTTGQKRMPKQVKIYDDVTVGGKLKVNGNSITSADANWLTISNGAGTANLQVAGNDIKVNGGLNIGGGGNVLISGNTNRNVTVKAIEDGNDTATLKLKAGSMSVDVCGWYGENDNKSNKFIVNGALQAGGTTVNGDLNVTGQINLGNGWSIKTDNDALRIIHTQGQKMAIHNANPADSKWRNNLAINGNSLFFASDWEVRGSDNLYLLKNNDPKFFVQPDGHAMEMYHKRWIND